MEYLEINSNMVNSIECMGKLKNLNYLRLDFNAINTNVDKILGFSFRNLKYLDFRNNKLQLINSHSFSDSNDNKLENLILMNNNLNYLKDFTFYNLKTCRIN